MIDRSILLALALLVLGMAFGAVHGQTLVTAPAASATVRPGDRIALKVWLEPEMSDTFRVAQSGEVVLPRLGSVQVLGQEVAALEDSLRHAYAEFLRNPSVEVTVLRRVGVHGEVRNPDLYWVDLTMTVRDVIALAGGLTEAGNPNRIAIVRGTETINFGQSQSAELITAELHSGDQVVVGRHNWFARNPFAVLGTGMGVVSFLMSILLPMMR